MRHAGATRAIKEQDREGEDDEVRVTMDDDDVDYPKTINEDLIAFGLTPDDVEDVGGAAAALFGSSAAPINLEVAPASDVAGSNNHESLTSTTGKRSQSAAWEDFTKVFETVNGKPIRVAGICKLKSKLLANSNVGTGHLLRYQKSCRKKADHAAMIQTRLAFNPDGSLRNWEYNPNVARAELCRLIAKLDLPLAVANTEAWDDYIKRAHNPKYVSI